MLIGATGNDPQPPRGGGRLVCTVKPRCIGPPPRCPLGGAVRAGGGRGLIGRHIYAIGANPEAARRAGINVARIRTIAFMLCRLTASLAGRRDRDQPLRRAGKAVNALLGGIVIAAIYNGLGLLGISAAGQDKATALMLLAAAPVDSLVRRRGAPAGAL